MVKSRRLIKWSVILGTVILIAGGIPVLTLINKSLYQNAPRIQINQPSYNFGNIKSYDGNVETTFELSNVGVSNLIISGMESSCGCTTARIKLEDKESPVFGMHHNPNDWSIRLEPDTTADLIVTFDPNFHKNTYGFVTRTVSIFSNDPQKKEVKVTINANVEQ